VGYLRSGPCLVQRRAEHCAKNLCQGRVLFNRFHRFEGREVIRESCPRLVPEVLVHLGYLKGLIYSSDKGDCGRPKTYIHFMKTPPRLTSNPEGTQLYIVGGNYRVTECGIEG
jgi:hypothetical protein